MSLAFTLNYNNGLETKFQLKLHELNTIGLFWKKTKAHSWLRAWNDSFISLYAV